MDVKKAGDQDIQQLQRALLVSFNQSIRFAISFRERDVTDIVYVTSLPNTIFDSLHLQIVTDCCVFPPGRQDAYDFPDSEAVACVYYDDNLQTWYSLLHQLQDVKPTLDSNA